MDCRRLIAFCMVLAYLFLPMDGFAQFQALTPSVVRSDTIAANGGTDRSHCPDSPCSDGEHGVGVCDASCSCCSCFAPLPSGVSIDFSPVVTSMIPFEPFRALPLVCLPIFVPPQNRS